MNTGVRIVHFRAENVKRLVAVRFDPDRLVNVVSGDNGAGKSAVMDSILYALGGKKALPAEPVRRGSDEAKITLDLGDFTVERRITQKGRDYLTIKTRYGLRFSSPQKMLDALMEHIAFDPAEWLRKKSKDQRAELLTIADLSIDMDGNRGERKQRFDDRTLVNRDLKRAAGALADLGEIEPLPDVPPLEEVFREQQEAQAKHNQQGMKEDAVRGTKEVIQKGEAELREFQARVEEGIAKRRAAIAKAKEELAAKEKRAEEAAKDLPDMEEIKERFEQARAAVALRKQHDEKERLEREVATYKKQSDELTGQIEALDEELENALKKAKMPVEGLSIGEDEVLFNGLPLNQASQAEQLRVSLAIATAVQEGKEDRHLKVVRIMDGSLLDDNSMRLVQEFAEEHDFQVWIERIERDGAKIVMEDGMVAAEKNSTEEVGRPAEDDFELDDDAGDLERERLEQEADDRQREDLS